MKTSLTRSRWAAVGAAVAVTLGAGGIGLVSATSPTGAVAYVPIEPCRAADTRPGTDNVGTRNTPLGTAETHAVNSNDGDCSGDVPATATGLQLNVTAVDASLPSFLTIWDEGTRPLASSLNPTPGEPPVPNAVTTSVTGAGSFNIYNNAGSVHIIVDIVGFYTDHDHDDRYYTEDEVDTALAAKANVADIDAGNLWAVVQSDGTLVRGSNVVDSINESTGVYRVNFNRDVSVCAYSVSDGDVTTGFPDMILVGSATNGANVNGVYIQTRDYDGNLTNGNFHLIVHC